MSTKISFDLTPIYSQLFQINANINALTDCILDIDDEAICKKFGDAQLKHFKRIVSEFNKHYPDLIDELPSWIDK
jgi:hypothetical protein